ncbi:MAG TPA: hypothetical protein VEK82_16265, partial [Stellaceae bacterium]|nr:hypothetical protein [Stellaceae bacterium]
MNRHGNVCAAAVLALSSLIIGACTTAPGGPAPVYMMGMAGSASQEPAAAAPTEPSTAPVALATWTEPSGGVGHTASDVIPLDDPPPQPAPAPARRISGAASTGEMLSAPPPSMLAASAAPAAAPAPAASPPAAPMVTASAGQEPSAAEEARAEAAPPPARERTASEPARADLVTAGPGVPRPAPYSR